jgi:hypothetical protein
MFEQNLKRELDSQDLRESKWQDAYDESYSESGAVVSLVNGECFTSGFEELAELFEKKPDSPLASNDIVGAMFRALIIKSAHEAATKAANEAESNGFQD